MQTRSSLPIMCLAVTLLLVACGDSSTPASVGSRAPDFSLPSLDGRTVTLNDLEGPILIVSFWATTCATCIQDVSHLNRIHREPSVTVLGVSLDPSSRSVATAVADIPIDYPVVLGGEDTFTRYGGFSIPYTVLLDSGRVVRKRISGPVSFAQLQELIGEMR